MAKTQYSFSDDTLLKRQDKAGELKVKVDRSERMSEEELTDLRSEIKVLSVLELCTLHVYILLTVLELYTLHA